MENETITFNVFWAPKHEFGLSFALLPQDFLGTFLALYAKCADLIPFQHYRHMCHAAETKNKKATSP